MNSNPERHGIKTEKINGDRRLPRRKSKDVEFTRKIK